MMTMTRMMMVIAQVMEPLLKKLGPSSWECVDSKLAWSRSVMPMMIILLRKIKDASDGDDA